MSTSSIRVRFAPSPTGMMHLGGVRTALMNYLFALQKNGIFIIRIEDTDTERNYDPQATGIINDILWLGLHYQHGPVVSGPDAPYFQSERTSIYQTHLTQLISNKFVYRCFCTSLELEKKRERQIALKQPPRYDKTCLKLSDQEIQKQLDKQVPFIWRMKFESDKSVTIHDLSHGIINFEFKNFSDFPLTRQDGSFTFIFANFVDDLTMKITHVIRGEDHLTNTACQAALYQAFEAPLPVFWHLPIICNVEGKKLSKRDFGFSLRDLKDTGYLPQAINNYLATIGGGTLDNQILTLPELARSFDFNKIHATGQVKYDVEKLKWFNHKWINELNPQELYDQSIEFIKKEFPQTTNIPRDTLTVLLQAIKPNMTTLADAAELLRFYFVRTLIQKETFTSHIDSAFIQQIATVLAESINEVAHPEMYMDKIKELAKINNIPVKVIYTALRLCLTGTLGGPTLATILYILGESESRIRIVYLINEITK